MKISGNTTILQAKQAYFDVKPFSCGIKGYAVSCPVADWQPYLRYFARNQYPEILILTTPTDSLLYPVTRSMHEDLLNHGIWHVYKEYTGRKNQLDHVFNVTFPDYEESTEANDDIIRYFQDKVMNR